MTTIALSDAGDIAADGLRCFGSERSSTDAKKITIIGRHTIYAYAGLSAMQGPIIAWFEAGHDPKDVPQFRSADYAHGWHLLVIKKDGSMFSVSHEAPYPLEASAPFTLGSGADYAMGALHAGASARQAVEIAAKLDVHTGGTIQVVSIAETFMRKTHMVRDEKTGKNVIRLESAGG